MKIHNTPTTAGATAYGRISSVRYAITPRTMRSLKTASSSDRAIPNTATIAEKNAVILKVSR